MNMDETLVELSWVVAFYHIGCPSQQGKEPPTYKHVQQSITPKGIVILSECEACKTKVLSTLELPELIRKLMEEQ